MGDVVGYVEPVARAVVRRDVGGIALKIPVDLGAGTKGTFEIGINLVSAPIDVFDDNPMAAFRLRQAIQKVLTEDITVKYGHGARSVEQSKFADILADAIIEKVRATL